MLKTVEESAHSQEWFATRLNWLCANGSECNEVGEMSTEHFPAMPFEHTDRQDVSAPLCREAMGDIVQDLKVIAHVDRMVILLELLKGPRSVSDLVTLSKLRQPTVSQMLAKLRGGGLVECRREGKSVIYCIAGARTRSLLRFLKYTYFQDGALLDFYSSVLKSEGKPHD